jgi:hypothetical protein
MLDVSVVLQLLICMASVSFTHQHVTSHQARPQKLCCLDTGMQTKICNKLGDKLRGKLKNPKTKD